MAKPSVSGSFTRIKKTFRRKAHDKDQWVLKMTVFVYTATTLYICIYMNDMQYKTSLYASAGTEEPGSPDDNFTDKATVTYCTNSISVVVST